MDPGSHGHVDDQVHGHVNEAGGDGKADHHRRVAQHRRVDGHFADARPGEDELDHRGTGHQARRLQTEQRHHRHQRVWQYVPSGDGAAGQPFRPRDHDEFLMQDVQHRGAREPRQDGNRRQRQHQRRHHNAFGRRRPKHRQQVPLRREKEDEDQRNPESRHGRAKHRHDLSDSVEGPAAAIGRQRAKWDRDDDANHDRGAGQQRRVADPVGVELGDRCVRTERASEVAMYGAAQPGEVAHRQWVVQMQLGPLEGQVLGSNCLSTGRLQEQIRGIARSQCFQSESE